MNGKSILQTETTNKNHILRGKRIMKVYALIFTIGLSSGHKELIGIYDTTERAEEIKEKHMKKNGHAKHHYKIEEIEINKTYNTIFNEW